MRNVPVAVIGASSGLFGAVWAQAELKKVVALIGARVVDVELPVSQAPTRFDADGRLVDEDIRERLTEVVNELVSSVREREAVHAAG
jgi:chromate reductase